MCESVLLLLTDQLAVSSRGVNIVSVQIISSCENYCPIKVKLGTPICEVFK